MRKQWNKEEIEYLTKNYIIQLKNNIVNNNFKIINYSPKQDR